MPFSPGGYSWLGISNMPKNVPLTTQAKKRLDSDLDLMKKSAITLESKIRLYHTRCKQYEALAGTKKGAKLLEQIESLKKEIKSLSKHISQSLNDSLE